MGNPVRRMNIKLEREVASVRREQRRTHNRETIIEGDREGQLPYNTATTIDHTKCDEQCTQGPSSKSSSNLLIPGYPQPKSSTLRYAP